MLKIEYLDNKVFIAYFFDQPCGAQNLGMYMMYCRLQFLKKILDGPSTKFEKNFNK